LILPKIFGRLSLIQAVLRSRSFERLLEMASQPNPPLQPIWFVVCRTFSQPLTHILQHPLASLSHPLSKHPHSSEDQILPYASSVLASLRIERDNERKAHAKTREFAEKKILALQARLSWHEVELERCITGGHAHDGCGGSGKDGEGDLTPRRRTSSPATMSPLPSPVDPLEKVGSEEIISMLDATVARNRILEGEVRTLFRRVCNFSCTRFRCSWLFFYRVAGGDARVYITDVPLCKLSGLRATTTI